MCWFVTLGVAPAGAPALEGLGKQRGGLGIHRSVNPHVARLFPRGDVRYEITHGGCSCDIYTSPPENGRSEKQISRERYRNTGWSEAKIERALSASVHARRGGAVGLFHEAVRHQVRSFGGVRLFAHLYGGLQDEEVVTGDGRCRIQLSAFVEEGFPAAMLVEIVE